MPIHALFDSAPAQFANDFVGRVRTGTQLNGRPMALENFRFTTGDPVVAEEIAHLFGGNTSEWETTGDDGIEVITETNNLNITLNSVKSEYLLWTRQGLARSCDGITQRDESPCHCKTQYSNEREWSKAAKQGLACGPSVEATFTLNAKPELGIWTFKSQSKTLAKGDPVWKKDSMAEGEIYSPPISEIEAMFVALDRSAEATLQLVGVSYTTKLGQPVSYTKPVLLIAEATEGLVAA